MSGNAKEMAALVAELRAQDWTMTLTTDGTSWKAAPPDKSKKIVIFSTKAEQMVAVHRELRHQGFVWPPPDRRPARPTPPAPIVTSTPFAPRPHPGITTESQRPSAPEPKQAAPARARDDDENVAFLELREAKEYEREAAAELIAARRKVEEAKAALTKASETYNGALADLRAKKAAFDASFMADVAPEMPEAAQ